MIRIVRFAELRSEEWERLVSRTSAVISSRSVKVREIIEKVRTEGDEALLEFTAEFDGAALQSLRVTSQELSSSLRSMPSDFVKALRLASSNLKTFHLQQKGRGYEVKTPGGSVFGQRLVPCKRVGVYVPGGTAGYPSTVLMTVIPAKIAGVEEIAVFSPPHRDGSLPNATLAACELLGVREVWKIGGAQAIAAMAYGTESIEKVEKVVGPGNVWVTVAKALVRDDVGIDFLAGPSEVLVVADPSRDPSLVALDLLAQAEHDTEATAVLITWDERFARSVIEEVERKLPLRARASIIETSLKNKGLILIARDETEALELANEYAPEHLVLMTKNPRKSLWSVRNAGSTFLGELSAVSMGDYCLGPTHVLPTMGQARYYDGLGVRDFYKYVTYSQVAKKDVRDLATTASTLARLEGLEAHAEAAEARLRIWRKA